jgi:hypothetical protein
VVFLLCKHIHTVFKGNYPAYIPHLTATRICRGIDKMTRTPGGLIEEHHDSSGREVFVLQRKTSKVGRLLRLSGLVLF